jgi:hypothetical protein
MTLAFVLVMASAAQAFSQDFTSTNQSQQEAAATTSGAAHRIRTIGTRGGKQDDLRQSEK